MFSVRGAAWLALAAALGVFAGLMPAFAYKTTLVFACSALFGLNIVCLLTGLMISSALPLASLLADELSSEFAEFSVQVLDAVFRASWLPGFKFSRLAHMAADLSICVGFFCVAYLILKFLFAKAEKFGEERHVFQDQAGSRWPLAKAVFYALCGVSACVLAMAAVSVDRNPALPKYHFSATSVISNISALPKSISINSLNTSDVYRPRRAHRLRRNRFTQSRKKEVCAFYVDWDTASLESLKRNIQYIDTVFTGWYGLDKNGGLIVTRSKAVDRLIAENHKRQQPFVLNYIGGEWNAGVLHLLSTDRKKAEAFIQAAAADVAANGYAGLNVDFEGLDSRDRKGFVDFMQRLCWIFHRKKLQVTIDVPAANDSYDYKALARCCDRLVVMAYDEHGASSRPGCIASYGWVDDVLAKCDDLPDGKLLVGLGSYGLDWTLGSKTGADPLSFSDVMSICSENGIKVRWNKATRNPFILYKEDGDDHVAWFLDAATFYNQTRQALENGAAGVALWRLGAEDESIWEIAARYGEMTSSKLLHAMELIKSVLVISYVGRGDLLYVNGSEQNGQRRYQTGADGYITDERYASYPVNYVVHKFGAAPKDKKLIALTFDDGPDAYYTPKILKILEDNNVRASFFLVGENAQNNPELVEREFADGDNIGNHTFTHPNVMRVSSEKTSHELNATQRVIQEITGHSTVLFRAPYNADSAPSGLEEFIPVIRAQKLGYLMVGESIDPNDWESPGRDVIVSRVMKDLRSGGIVLLHDGGGLRDDTLAALPVLIKKLKAAGYEFVTVDQLMKVGRDDIMKPVGSGDPYLTYDRAFFGFLHAVRLAVEYIFYVTVILGIAKLLFLGFLSARQKRKYSSLKFRHENFTPFVSVLIPCYNEAAVICRTVESVLRSNYKDFEVIVVDDGSTDDSWKLVTARFRDDQRVRVLHKANGGKPRALNLALKEARGGIIIAIDADTLFDKEAIRLMVRYFEDPKVAAVSGNVKVGNRGRMITEWQHTEYVTGFNLERRAYSELNCITVVPGAIGAWRRDLVLDRGGFDVDTLAEDTDMTLSLLEDGWRIAFEENARAYTETPETFRSLLKQRFRWTYGTLQCLWKHRSAMFSTKQKTLGFIAMPFMWLFQYIFQTFCPIVDVYMIFSIIFGSSSEKVVISYIVFLLVDLASSLFAFRLEREDPRPLLWVPIQRLVYRFLMAYIVLKALAVALHGRSVGWNKLKRTGSVTENI